MLFALQICFSSKALQGAWHRLRLAGADRAPGRPWASGSSVFLPMAPWGGGVRAFAKEVLYDALRVRSGLRRGGRAFSGTAILSKTTERRQSQIQFKAAAPALALSRQCRMAARACDEMLPSRGGRSRPGRLPPPPQSPCFNASCNCPRRLPRRRPAGHLPPLPVAPGITAMMVSPAAFSMTGLSPAASEARISYWSSLPVEGTSQLACPSSAFSS